MKINNKKTQLLVVSPPNDCVTLASLSTQEGNELESVERLRLVVLTFGTEPGVATHIEAIEDR